MLENKKLAQKNAREENQLRIEKLIFAHSKVVAMLRSRRAKGSVIRYAFKQISKWRYRRLCSYDYINEWSKLLLSPMKTADLLEERSERGNRLRQNTPFASYLI